jgi:hypothetical protein
LGNWVGDGNEEVLVNCIWKLVKVVWYYSMSVLFFFEVFFLLKYIKIKKIFLILVYQNNLKIYKKIINFF